ncbi:efflux RND transporter periplasmic adaptor subunit [Salinisphaera orenii]|nr:efflux RND transporter periplasmic adaptor subunit [Salinisphaera halophila]
MIRRLLGAGNVCGPKAAFSTGRAAVWLVMLFVGSTALAAPTMVETVDVEQQRWRQTLPLYGTLTSPRDAELTPRVAGLVERVDVDAGDRVDAGETLITLDRSLARLTLNTLEASVAEARAQLAEAERLASEAERLAARSAISQTELASRRSEVDVQAAALDRLRAEAARQREVLDRHEIVAPFAGTVRERLVEPGEYVAESTPVVGLVATERLRMDVAAPQQYFSAIEAGMPVRIQPEALHGETLEAKVDVKVAASDALARTFLARIFVDNAAGRLTPGMSAKVLFEITSPEEVLVIPRDALVREPRGGTRVWIVESGDEGLRAVERQVSLGRSADNRVEVLSGLSAGDRVIVRGNESLSRGQRVRLAEPRAGPDRPATATDRSLRLSDGTSG